MSVHHACHISLLEDPLDLEALGLSGHNLLVNSGIRLSLKHFLHMELRDMNLLYLAYFSSNKTHQKVPVFCNIYENVVIDCNRKHFQEIRNDSLINSGIL